MNTRHLKCVPMVLLFVLLGGMMTASVLPAHEPYHLGVALGLTGTGPDYSLDAVDAVKLAVDEINKQGGILGKHPIKLFVRDTMKTRP